MSDSTEAGTLACVARADASQQSFATCAPDTTLQLCPLQKYIVVVPRKPANIFLPDHGIRPLLPDRYPPAQSPSKAIESNFYPDLHSTRTITAVATDEAWNMPSQRRPAPAAGLTIAFAKGGRTTADIKLSATSAVTDAEGCASIEITVQDLQTTQDDIQAAATIEIIATLPKGNGGASAAVVLTIHRNEDVDAALAPAERPDDFASALAPVLNLQTWIVGQPTKPVTSPGAKAVQQLLNQVACRRNGGGHRFQQPDGQFGAAARDETARFIADFSAEPAAGATALAVFTGRQFSVGVEEIPISPAQGVKTYVEAEYGHYAEGCLVDAHLLVGQEKWVRGAAAKVAKADGLLDLYTAVVWEFIETAARRGRQYADVALNWYRHPKDNGPANSAWPALVQTGVAYWYGGARSLEQFQSDLAANSAVPADATWFQYLRQNNSRIGLHMNGDDIVVPTAAYQQYAHLNTDTDITNTTPPTAPPPNAPHYVLHHAYISRVMRQYTGIDCSGFCQHVATDPVFGPEHCADLANERICRPIDLITHNDGLADHKLSTTSWRQHYAAMPAATWRPEVAFRGDLLNVSGKHIVVLETNDRTGLVTGGAGDVWILQASGDDKVTTAAQPYWPQTECVRRVVHSPLAQWKTGWDTWGNAQTNVEYGRIYLWN